MLTHFIKQDNKLNHKGRSEYDGIQERHGSGSYSFILLYHFRLRAHVWGAV
jgi:hypothetical protein